MIARVCTVCGQAKSRADVVSADLVRDAIADLIQAQYPHWSDESYICHDDLARFRSEYVEDMLEAEKGELGELEREVVESIKAHETVSADVDTEFEQALSFGDRLADRMAAFGGSWHFIILFGVFMLLWILINSLALLWKPPDPYPYILLNLILSCLAALQAPVIMMSQNRQEAKDRLRSEHDYQVNLKAELEIRQLHEKIDHLMLHQWQRLVDIQQVQIELLNDIVQKGPGRKDA